MRIALSFDDGPNNITTPHVLDLLEEHHIPASFFLIANNISPETEGQIRRAVSLGCDIENHSITHRPMADMPVEEVREEILRMVKNQQEIHLKSRQETTAVNHLKNRTQHRAMFER